jgi:nitrogen fixation NifU-like protein
MQPVSDIPDVPLSGLYGDRILDHYRNPRHRSPVLGADIETEEFNPFCGDRVSVQLKLDTQGRVTQVASQAQGCSIIQASASMMAEVMAGKSLEELENLAQALRNMMQGKQPLAGWMEETGDLQSLQVVRRFPVRIKCALLPWTALEEGIQEFRSRKQAKS